MAFVIALTIVKFVSDFIVIGYRFFCRSIHFFNKESLWNNHTLPFNDICFSPSGWYKKLSVFVETRFLNFSRKQWTPLSYFYILQKWEQRIYFNRNRIIKSWISGYSSYTTHGLIKTYLYYRAAPYVLTNISSVVEF